ncbi:MAG: hypothetical protein J7501_17380 [Bdellovibrio sp.]|nr:hypothetical protein [Bdellovibrio sp.]
MEPLNKLLLLALSALYLSACGVKGAPLPPLNPAPIGRGEPTYSEANRNKKTKPKAKTYQDQERGNADDNGGDL